jgi:hypothetical protein
MSIVKRILGLLAVVFGLIGVLLSLAGIGGIWLLDTHLATGVEQVFDPIENTLLEVDNRLDAASENATSADSAKLTNAKDFVKSIDTKTTTLKSNITKWISASAVIVTLVLVWLGVAQLSLLIHGWKWLRTS